MSAAIMTGNSEAVPVPVAEPPPIAMLLPLLQIALTWLSFLIRFGARILLVLLYPLHTLWFIIYALLSPITLALKISLDITLFTPLSIIRTVAVALYPVYVFCAVACITGAVVGIIGQYISASILRILARSHYFTQPSGSPRTASPSISQGILRKRKRKSVRLQ